MPETRPTLDYLLTFDGRSLNGVSTCPPAKATGRVCVCTSYMPDGPFFANLRRICAFSYLYVRPLDGKTGKGEGDELHFSVTFETRLQGVAVAVVEDDLCVRILLGILLGIVGINGWGGRR